ncbi:alpha/beta hydrolase family protein [Lysobacter changpingensis]|uniref:alpha/beta hydrolase family protein n=1 Tax=Lysobacter changpingensis TaxID=2792784 RepID=UPI001A90187F|nr:alpha/beta fold hydrolase [Lysobacter changpingensis]
MKEAAGTDRRGGAAFASGVSPVEARVESLRLPVADDHFCATFATPLPALPAVIFVHGWNGTQEFDLGHLRDAVAVGCAVLTVDLRGHDRDDPRHDHVSREDNLRDLLAAYDWLVARDDVDERAIAVVGFSYGAYLATLLTERRRVQWLALRSPALYPDEGWDVSKHALEERVELAEYRRHVQAPGGNRALTALAEFRGDVLLVCSQDDQVLPAAVAESFRGALVRASSITTRTISGADHELSHPDAKRAWADLLQDWLAAMIGGARRQAVVSALEARHEEVDGAGDPHERA